MLLVHYATAAVFSFSWNANEEKYTNFVSNRIVKADVKAVQTHTDCAVNSKLKSVECFLINSGISDPLLILSGGKNTQGGKQCEESCVICGKTASVFLQYCSDDWIKNLLFIINIPI